MDPQRYQDPTPTIANTLNQQYRYNLLITDLMSFVPAGDTTTSVQAIQSANATVLITSTSAPAIIDQAAHELRVSPSPIDDLAHPEENCKSPSPQSNLGPMEQNHPSVSCLHHVFSASLDTDPSIPAWVSFQMQIIHSLLAVLL